MSEPIKIWAAYRKNYSDDSRCSDPFIGYFEGEMKEIEEWLTVKGHDWARLTRIEPEAVTKAKIERLQAAKQQKAKADAEFENAQ